MDFSLVAIWHHMGLIPKLLCIMMLFLSVYTLAVMLERALILRRARTASAAFAGMVDKEDPSIKMSHVMQIAEQPERGKYCFLAQLVLAALREAEMLTKEGQRPAVVYEAAQATLARSIVLTVTALRKRLVTLATSASGAPFVGLFATIMGLIRAFQEIAVTETGGIAAVSGGIAEALIGTLVGLFVAIPAMWAYNWFADRIDALAVELNTTAGRVVERLLRREFGSIEA
ncbi:MAG: MotA/TolQ/ExbB proton channel family protein [Candidatus Latescibacterota bacterium]